MRKAIIYARFGTDAQLHKQNPSKLRYRCLLKYLRRTMKRSENLL